jgi:hypothetical protein
MNHLGAEALDFSELFPFLKLEDAARLDSDGLDELPDEHMMELLQALSNELEAEEEADAKEQLAQETKSDDQAVPARAGSVDGSNQSIEEADTEGDKGQPISTRVRTYTARKVGCSSTGESFTGTLAHLHARPFHSDGDCAPDEGAAGPGGLCRVPEAPSSQGAQSDGLAAEDAADQLESARKRAPAAVHARPPAVGDDSVSGTFDQSMASTSTWLPYLVAWNSTTMAVPTCQTTANT